RATVREEPERHGANPIEPEAECEEEPEGERIRMEIVAPCEIQEHRDREDVRMHHAVQEPEEGDDLPILPSHSTTTRRPRDKDFFGDHARTIARTTPGIAKTKLTRNGRSQDVARRRFTILE